MSVTGSILIESESRNGCTLSKILILERPRPDTLRYDMIIPRRPWMCPLHSPCRILYTKYIPRINNNVLRIYISVRSIYISGCAKCTLSSSLSSFFSPSPFLFDLFPLSLVSSVLSSLSFPRFSSDYLLSLFLYPFYVSSFPIIDSILYTGDENYLSAVIILFFLNS